MFTIKSALGNVSEKSEFRFENSLKDIIMFIWKIPTLQFYMDVYGLERAMPMCIQEDKKCWLINAIINKGFKFTINSSK